MNRGSAAQARPVARAVAGFNEAPIHESGKCPRCAVAGLCHSSASMRPRFMNRGSDRRGCQARQARQASMRPRFMNRGSPCVVIVTP